MTNLEIKNGKATTIDRAPKQWFGLRSLFEGRVHFAKTGQVSFIASQHNIDIWKSAFPECVVTDLDAEAKLFEEFVVRERPKFGFKRQPLDHQLKAFDQFKDKKLSAVFGSVGSGKTKIAVDLMANYYCQGVIDAIVVVAINKLVTRQWHEKQLQRDMPDNILYSSIVYENSKKGKREFDSLKEFDGLQILCINVDAFRTENGIATVAAFLKRHNNRVLFDVDESQTIKTPGSERSKGVAKQALKCEYRMIMSGTPISVNLIDYWAQFKVLDERIIGMKYMSAFRSRYCLVKPNGWGGVDIVGSQNTEELYGKTAPYTFRITKEELGFKDFDDEFEFELGQNEKKHYQSLKKTFMTQLDSGEFLTASNALSAMLRLQQVSNGILHDPETGNIQLLECSRLAALQSWLEMIEDEKVVIWTRFLRDSQLVMDKLGKECVDISGNVDPDERYANVQRFIDEPSIRYCVGTPKSAGVGVDGLNTVTNRAVFYSNSEHALDYWQARGRTSRVGGDTNAFYCHLIGKGTVDRKIMNNLLKKEALSSLMLDDIRRLWDE